MSKFVRRGNGGGKKRKTALHTEARALAEAAADDGVNSDEEVRLKSKRL